MATERGVKAAWFTALCYEEHIEAVKNGLELFGYDYVMARHDKCTDKDGKPKKVHWHLVVLSNTVDYQFTLAKRLGLENRFVKPPKSDKPNGAVRYLTHIDNPEKVQYERSIIETNLDEEELEKLFTKLDSNGKKSDKDDPEALLADIEKVGQHKLGLRAFLLAHPAFIYQAKSLLTLVELSKDMMWNGCQLNENGEVIEQTPDT